MHMAQCHWNGILEALSKLQSSTSKWVLQCTHIYERVWFLPLSKCRMWRAMAKQGTKCTYFMLFGKAHTKMYTKIGISWSQVQRTLHDDFYLYHSQEAYQLLPGLHANHVQFFRWLKGHPKLLNYILFMDEAQFHNDGITNTRNSTLSLSHDNLFEVSKVIFNTDFQ